MMAIRAVLGLHVKKLVRGSVSLALVVGASILFAPAPVSEGQSTSGPVVSTIPESPTVQADAASFEVEVFVSEVTNDAGLGGYDLFLNFDPTVIRVISVSDSGWLLSTNNIVICVPPYIDNTVGQAILSCVTVPLFVGPGPKTTRPQLLATALFQPVVPGISFLSLDGTALSDPQGVPLERTLEGSQVRIAPAQSTEPAPPTPTVVTILSPVPPATETLAGVGTPTPGIATPVEAAGPTAAPILPPIGSGPDGGGSSWVFPLAGGIVGAVAAGFAAVLGLRAWRRRQGRLAGE
jgi:hypothetical protein